MMPAPRMTGRRLDLLGDVADGRDGAEVLPSASAGRPRSKCRRAASAPVRRCAAAARSARASRRSRARHRPAPPSRSRGRCDSPYSRAFWMAVPMLAASVVSRPTSALAEAAFLGELWTLIAPIASSPTHDRHAQVRPRRPCRCPACSIASKCVVLVEQQRLARLDDVRGQALAELDRRLRARAAAVLAVVRELDEAGGRVVAARRRRCRP